MAKPAYQRVLLKLSGEALEGAQGHGLDAYTLSEIADQVKEAAALGVQIGVVLGGGNFMRGGTSEATGMDRPTADAMGMMATAINCLALEDSLRRLGQPALTMSAIPYGQLVQPFHHRRAREELASGKVVLFAAGTGNPYFTTDSAASLRALEIGADAMLKATKVDGIYDRDPKKDQGAVRFDEITYDEVLAKRLQVMDLTAVAMCRENNMPLIVFDMTTKGNIRRVLMGERGVGSRVVSSPASK